MSCLAMQRGMGRSAVAASNVTLVLLPKVGSQCSDRLFHPERTCAKAEPGGGFVRFFQ